MTIPAACFDADHENLAGRYAFACRHAVGIFGAQYGYLLLKRKVESVFCIR